MQKSDLYDVIVIGAGAAGLIAAISAAREGKKTLLLEILRLDIINMYMD